MGRDGQRRRSPRISALDCKENHQIRQLSKTRNGMKRKVDDSGFAPVSKLAKQVWKGRDSPEIADDSTDFVEWRSVCESGTIKENQKHNDHAVTNGKAAIMPAKQLLELVLDTLQRRDTYEIFAEPVDPDEVEDYYEIIKEPMDFGTMRAKLHEGMYENLQQFEHDVFLIAENAMHFNSSATIYFRQARAMHELAKKVFHVLTTDPDNFASEFSSMRRRSMRKALSEATKGSKLDVAKTGGVCPSTSTFRRMSKKNSVMTEYSHARDSLTGSKHGRRLSSAEGVDRRSTYFYDKKSSPDSIFYSRSTPLVLMNQGDISYEDSLMSFVKDLGPIAQMVAKRKLLGQHDSYEHRINGTEKCPNPANEFKTFRDFAPASASAFLKLSKNTIIDLTKDAEEEVKEGEETKCRNQRKEKIETDNDRAKGKEKIDMPKRVASIATRNPSPVSRSTSKGNHKPRPVILALESPHVGEFKARVKRNHVVPTPLIKTRPVCDEATQEQQQQQRPPLPIAAPFTFDLPFLKARLSQMKAAKTGGNQRVDRGSNLRKT